MASVELDFSELSEFNASMLKMVEKDMPNEAKKLMQRAGNALRRDIRTAYKQKTKRKTGNLLRGLSRGRAYIYQGTEYQVRVKNTAPMKLLNPAERQNNLKKAFIMGRNDVKLYDRIVLIDDIYTTGTTLDEISALLKANGVSEVYCVTLACGSGL